MFHVEVGTLVIYARYVAPSSKSVRWMAAKCLNESSSQHFNVKERQKNIYTDLVHKIDERSSCMLLSNCNYGNGSI